MRGGKGEGREEGKERERERERAMSKERMSVVEELKSPKDGVTSQVMRRVDKTYPTRSGQLAVNN